MQGKDRREGPRHRADACCSAAPRTARPRPTSTSPSAPARPPWKRCSKRRRPTRWSASTATAPTAIRLRDEAVRPERCRQLREEVPDASGSTPRATTCTEDFIDYCTAAHSGRDAYAREGGRPAPLRPPEEGLREVIPSYLKRLPPRGSLFCCSSAAADAFPWGKVARRAG